MFVLGEGVEDRWVIGLALDPDGGRVYVTDLAGNVYAADLGGSNRREILVLQGNLTGVARAVLPPTGTRRRDG
ncbi:hypothetical protein [Streptomyces sp. NPDC001880]